MNVYTLIPSPGSRVPENGGHHSHSVLHQESLQTSSCQTPGHQKVWWYISCSYNGYTLTKCVLSPYPPSPTSLPQSSHHSFHPGVRDSLAVDHWSNKWCENVPRPLRPMRVNPSLPAGPETTTSESLQCCCLYQYANAMLYYPPFLPQQEPSR